MLSLKVMIMHNYQQSTEMYIAIASYSALVENVMNLT